MFGLPYSPTVTNNLTYHASHSVNASLDWDILCNGGLDEANSDYSEWAVVPLSSGCNTYAYYWSSPFTFPLYSFPFVLISLVLSPLRASYFFFGGGYDIYISLCVLYSLRSSRLDGILSLALSRKHIETSACEVSCLFRD